MKWFEDAENDFQELKIKRWRKRDITEKNENLSPRRPKFLRHRRFKECVDRPALAYVLEYAINSCKM
jgi:hypothetical protein